MKLQLLLLESEHHHFSSVQLHPVECAFTFKSSRLNFQIQTVMPTMINKDLISFKKRRVRYVTLPWWQDFWISTYRGPANIAEEKNEKKSHVWLHSSNKTMSKPFLPSFVNANGRVCQKDCWVPEILLPWKRDVTLLLSITGNVTSHFITSSDFLPR